ncbi:hypothetical protein L218DRAFT_400553 [Marasmius fiardii PR-910]|nr:hypothetical protein L218DRAFT_400553 [Marasmius fiardii PR-910]
MAGVSRTFTVVFLGQVQAMLSVQSKTDTITNSADLDGPFVAGMIILFSLFSVLSVQIFLYYYAFTRDKLFTRILVFVVYSLILTQAIMAGHSSFMRTIGEDVKDLGWFFVATVGGLVGFIVQNFYVWRIYILSGRWIGAILISLVSLGSTVSALVSAYYGSFTGDPVERIGSSQYRVLMVNRALGVSYVLSVICDVAIAIYMTCLLTQNGKIMHKKLRIVVRRLLLLTIHTNFLTSAWLHSDFPRTRRKTFRSLSF